MEEEKVIDVQHVDEQGRNVVLASSTDSEKVFNRLLILSCVAFGCTSILFGYDDKVISPVAAMVPFVRRPYTLYRIRLIVHRSRNFKVTTRRPVATSSVLATKTWCSAYRWSEPFSEPLQLRH
jgi:hypothetical protein